MSGAVPEGYPASVLPYLGIEIEPVLHVIPAIRLSSTSGSGSGQFICSRRTLASRREAEASESMGGEDSREASFRLGCSFIGFIGFVGFAGFIDSLTCFSSARLGLNYPILIVYGLHLLSPLPAPAMSPMTRPERGELGGSGGAKKQSKGVLADPRFPHPFPAYLLRTNGSPPAISTGLAESDLNPLMLHRRSLVLISNSFGSVPCVHGGKRAIRS